jgi:hypothetical protein
VISCREIRSAPRIRALGITGAAFMGAEGKDPAAGREGLTARQGAQESRIQGKDPEPGPEDLPGSCAALAGI